MLPTFQGPVSWRLGDLPGRDDVMPLLELEAAEFAAVLGQPVRILRDEAGPGGGGVWDVSIDPSVTSATLESDLEARRLHLTLPDASVFADGVNLLHSLAFAPTAAVTDTEAETYAEVFDRIRDEVANVYPAFALRGLDWDRITARHVGVRDLVGSEFWDRAARWVAELADAHTQLIVPPARSHPPYLAEMGPGGAVLRRVPADSDAWAAGVRARHTIPVDDPAAWLARVGASPQQHALVAGRRFLAMTEGSRTFDAVAPDGVRRSWTERRRRRPAVVAHGNLVRIEVFTPDVPDLLREAVARADRHLELTLDLRGNAGGSLVAAAEARRMLVRDDEPFGTVAFTTGRGELAEPVPLRTSPAARAWPGSVRVLVDAMTYSAAEDFLHPLVGLPHVTVVGGPTGGGSGRPHTRLLKDGVRLAVSTAITWTRDEQPIELRGIGATSR